MDDTIKQLEACHDHIQRHMGMALSFMLNIGRVEPTKWECEADGIMKAHSALLDRLKTTCHCPLERAGISDLGECTYIFPGDKCTFKEE